MLETIPKIPLFEELTPRQAEALQALFEPAHYPAGAVILERGEVSTYLYIAVQGEAAIHYKPYDGPSLVLSRLRAGDVFGWSAVVGGRYYTSTIVSETEMEVIRVKGCDLLALLKTDPETGKIAMERIARSVSPRWRNAREQVEALLSSRCDKGGSYDHERESRTRNATARPD